MTAEKVDVKNKVFSSEFYTWKDIVSSELLRTVNY